MTDHGQALLGHATTRNKDVQLYCAVGLAFYLMYCFSATYKIKDFTLDAWIENSH
jgi:hypothetical protein